jgi:REP-associated tyrosine transposase
MAEVQIPESPQATALLFPNWGGSPATHTNCHPCPRLLNENGLMSHTYAAAYFHCVFSTKDRQNAIPDELRPKLWAYIQGTARNLGVIAIAVGGTSNHAHLLLGLRPNANIAEVVQKLKANSSRWMGEHSLAFEWQKGYATLTVSPSLVGRVRAYVLNQEEHHRRRSFEEEFLALLNKAGIAHDEERVFAA